MCSTSTRLATVNTVLQAYLVTLINGKQIVARVARRFMPRLKTESEVATLNYLRENTNIPVPYVYHHDSNPYNRLGGEYILMSKVLYYHMNLTSAYSFGTFVRRLADRWLKCITLWDTASS